MADILRFTGITRVELHPDAVLAGAQEMLRSVVVVGRDLDGDRLYLAASESDLRNVYFELLAAARMIERTFDDGDSLSHGT